MNHFASTRLTIENNRLREENGMLRLLSVVLVALIVLCEVAHAMPAQRTDVGISPFALMKPDFPARKVAQLVRLQPHPVIVSWLYHTFGTFQPARIDQIARTNNVAYFQVHLVNEVCLRNRNCGSYEFASKFRSTQDYEKRINTPFGRRALKRYIRPLRKYILAHPEQVWYISPGLESNLSRGALNRLSRTLSRLFKRQSPIVQNAWPNRKAGRAWITEQHNLNITANSPCIANLDGVSLSVPATLDNHPEKISPMQAREWLLKHAQCDRLLWSSQMNCRSQYKSFVDPRSRECQDVEAVLEYHLKLLKIMLAPRPPIIVD